MRSLPLVLNLERLLPQRTPDLDEGRAFNYGFQPRLPDGPLIDRRDPLLAAVGAEVVTVVATREHGEAMQDESVEPGRRLQAIGEGYDQDGDEVVGVWDAEGIHCAGRLPSTSGERVSAALDQGIEVDLIALSEQRAVLDDRRMALDVLVFPREILRVEHDPELRIVRPQRPVRRRVVLFADAQGEVRWWDAAASSGPADVADLPVSQELRRDLKRLRKSYAKLAKHAEHAVGGYEITEADWHREALEEQGVRLWRRARSELGREYAIGYLGPGMDSPAWSPAELEGDEAVDDDFPL